ncbi:uncharacterized protein LOC103958731 [Pyrus x bretschneideri]|uniref:uncharacterized protein LOC103958731 n=1 Tax=Pyrus x bretschneideri TaxID=225117 RepID=UPI00202F91A3|nr:uncharacterized protein LOC103958731 [Pyrus x bretschneideri]
MNCSKTVVFIWLLYALLFYSLFQMALRNSDSSRNYTSASDSVISNKERRSALYDQMGRDLAEHGPVFLKHGGQTSQSLSLSDIFTIRDGSVAPVLKAANPPVRANVLYLSTQYSLPILKALKPILDPYFDEAIWFQNSSLYHFSMFHASHHISPVPATPDEIEAEAAAVRNTAEGLCPLKIVLDRVVLTSTGVLLGCWQVTSGSDPVTIREKLRTALPHAPEKQLYDAAILHTSFARLLGHPKASSTVLSNTSEQVHFFQELVNRLNNELQGLEAVVSELWYVEEFDVLALALNGRMKVRKFQLGCSRS